MATCCKRRYSRRRLAALSFLSNISLDGTHQDTKIAALLTKKSGTRDHKKKIFDAYPAKCRFGDNIAGDLCKDRLLYDLSDAEFEDEKEEDRLFAYCAEQSDTKLNEEAAVGAFTFQERTCSIGSGDLVSVSPHPISASGPAACPASSRSLAIPLAFHESAGVAVSSDHSEHVVLVPPQNNRRISSNVSEGSHSPTGSGVREKEVRFFTSVGDLTNHLTDQRLVLVTGSDHHSPIMVFSTLSFARSNKLARGEFRGESGRRRHTSGSRPISSAGEYPNFYAMLGLPKPEEGQVISYRQMLVPSRYFGRDTNARRLQSTGDYCEAEPVPLRQSNVMSRCLHYDSASHRGAVRPASPLAESAKPDAEEGVVHLASNFNYHPSLLDDPELIAGKHSTLLTFPSYMTSVIDYVKPSDLKKELNDKFREKFPHIQLTLSKLRSLKREMRKVAKQESGADLLTVAQAYVYFEKLILRGLVNKGNRKLCAGATLLLSAKMNDVKGETLTTLIEKIESTFRVNRRELIASEFAVLVALEFSLHLPTWEIFSHYQRLLYDS